MAETGRSAVDVRRKRKFVDDQSVDSMLDYYFRQAESDGNHLQTKCLICKQVVLTCESSQQLPQQGPDERRNRLLDHIRNQHPAVNADSNENSRTSSSQFSSTDGNDDAITRPKRSRSDVAANVNDRKDEIQLETKKFTDLLNLMYSSFSSSAPCTKGLETSQFDSFEGHDVSIEKGVPVPDKVHGTVSSGTSANSGGTAACQQPRDSSEVDNGRNVINLGRTGVDQNPSEERQTQTREHRSNNMTSSEVLSRISDKLRLVAEKIERENGPNSDNLLPSAVDVLHGVTTSESFENNVSRVIRDDESLRPLALFYRLTSDAISSNAVGIADLLNWAGDYFSGHYAQLVVDHHGLEEFVVNRL